MMFYPYPSTEPSAPASTICQWGMIMVSLKSGERESIPATFSWHVSCRAYPNSCRN